MHKKKLPEDGYICPQRGETVQRNASRSHDSRSEGDGSCCLWELPMRWRCWPETARPTVLLATKVEWLEAVATRRVADRLELGDMQLAATVFSSGKTMQRTATSVPDVPVC